MNQTENYTFHTTIPPKVRILETHGGKDCQVTDRYLLKNGKPWLPVSGEVHYSRLHRDLWNVELDKMKAAKRFTWNANGKTAEIWRKFYILLDTAVAV